MAAGVQFYGIDKVMDMFDARAVDAWSIWHGREFQFKGFGDAELRSVLESLKNSFNDPIYTLKVYEGFDSADKIKSNTPHDGSFNFKINVPMEITGLGYVQGNANTKLIERIERLEAEKNRPVEDLEEEEEPETIGNAIGSAVVEVIKDPEKAMQWVTMIRSIFNPNYQPQQQTYRPPALLQPATVGNVAPEKTEADIDRLSNAIDALEKADPQIIEHLEKLADIATKNPGQFKFLLSLLNTIK